MVWLYRSEYGSVSTWPSVFSPLFCVYVWFIIIIIMASFLEGNSGVHAVV